MLEAIPQHLLERIGELGNCKLIENRTENIYEPHSLFLESLSKRVAIARALANEPEILLADEPTGNLDSKTGKEIMGIFNKLHREGRTILMVTHDIGLAQYCDRIIKLKDGRIENE